MTITETKCRPIIFNGEMVRAILGERKSQTRRVIKPQPIWDHGAWSMSSFAANTEQGFSESLQFSEHKCPYGQPGDRLWPRHSFWKATFPSRPKNNHIWDEFTRTIRWESGHEINDCEPCLDEPWWKKKPSIFMPRWASRITLEVTDVRVQRVQEISEADAIAEGTKDVSEFRELWNSINKLRGFGWDTNPFCWCITFKRVEESNA